MNMMAETLDTASGMDAETLLRMAHIKILNDRRTYALGAATLLGESRIVDDIPTAATDGRDKFYGRDFMNKQTLKQAVYVVLHENLHVLKMDIQRHRDLIEEDPKLCNVAADYVVNGIIESLGADDIIERPTVGPLVSAKYDGWDIRAVYEDLRQKKEEQKKQKEEQKQQGQGSSDEEDDESGPQPLDQHDDTGAMSPEEAKQLEEDIRSAIHQAGILAGVSGGSLPHAIKAAVAPEVRWQDEMQDYVTAAMRGDDDLTFRKYDRRYITEDIYYPTTYTERVGELLLCMDTSGSTYGPVLDEFIMAFKQMVDLVRPERVRVLHWDDGVRREDLLTEQDYMQEDLGEVLRPIGGGGTNVTAVSDYIIERGITADVCLVFTDGYIEHNPEWRVTVPTLWLVTRREQFEVPGNGQMVKVRRGS